MAGLLRNIKTVGGDSMSTKKRATKLKIMHELSKDGNGKPTIHSIVSNPPKLKEAVGPDKVQAAEETAHKTTKKDTPKNEMTEEQRSVLQALHDLGGKDQASMDIAKKLGFDKKFPDAPRAPVRNAMERLHELHYVTSKKTGIKYNYSITDKGIEALKAKHVATVKDKEAGSVVKPASNPGPSERPANTDIQCSECNTFNPFHAEYCKTCGAPMKAAPVVVAA
jgi:ribosomal protein L40E